MMRSGMEAMAGNKFWFSAGPAALGLMIHMMFGLVLGAIAWRTAPADSPTAEVRGARSAMLSR